MSFIREPNAEPITGYRLIEPLGSGGFGEVWKCEAPGGLFKAIKFVYGNLNSLDSEGVRAEQELHALNRIKEVRHPFVLSLDRIESIGGELVIVMELADKSLHDLFQECQAAGQVGIGRDSLLRYIRDAAEALDHMIEKHNLLHLDIKPRNLFLISDRVKVADFGLVKSLGRSGASGILGGVTPLYAPPETLQNKISENSDQYSLAIVYQELLTGQRPFNGKNARQLALQHLNEPPELRVLPETERPVVARALAKDPSQRFPNCLAFVRALYLARNAVPETLREASNYTSRPKTMADTMEDILLEHPAEDALAPAPEAADDDILGSSGLGITRAQPNTGALRPTILLGVGAFGRRALMELRCRFLDRFGDLSKVPMVCFLYADTDPEALKSATRGGTEVALTGSEVCPLPLQPVANYRRRMLDALSDWLPREKLYAVPRSLQTGGSRALGRLAFADNHLRFLARVKRELQHATHPDTLYQTVSQTGLALRDAVPRVYVIAAAGGGGSGLLVDLGYALRRLLQQIRQPTAEVIAFLFCGAPSDPATPRAEQANVYATLTELHHFHDPGIPFSAQYGADGPRLTDEGPPFTSIYLQQLAHRSPESLRDAVAHLGSYIFHDVTTTLGMRLDRARRSLEEGPGPTPFRSFGTYAVWFPRGLMLRLAARQACARLLVDWQATGEPTAAEEVQGACARALAEPELRFEAICSHIEANAHSAGEGNPADALTAVLSRLEEQALQTLAQDDPGSWARQALGRVREWVGSGLGVNTGSDWRRGKLSRALSQATNQLADAWGQKLCQVAFGLMEHPGKRVAAAESALVRFQRFCLEAAAAQQDRLLQQSQRTQLASEHLEVAMEHCMAATGTFSFFGGRGRRQLRVFMDHLAAYTRQRLAEEVLVAGLQFYSSLQGRLNDRLQDMTFCRQRLRHLQETFEAPSDEADFVGNGVDLARLSPEVTPSITPLPSTETFWEAIRQSGTVRVVLPEGDMDLERAASRFLGTLSLEQWTQLDQMVQDQVLGALGGLHKACLGSGDLLRNVARPLIDQTAICLSDLLPTTDVAQVEFSIQGNDLAHRIGECMARATPLITGKDKSAQHEFLLIPASDAGKVYGDRAKEVLPGLHVVKVPGRADLMFCREQGFLQPADLHPLLAACRTAYDATAPAPTASPHARFDIVDWLPIDP